VLVSKLPEADHDAGEVEEALIDEAVMLTPNHQTTELADPGDRAFDLPASSVPSQLPTVLSGLSLATSAVRRDEIPPLLPKTCPQLVAVVSPVSDQRRGRFPGRDGFEDPFDQRDLSRRSTFGPACEWNTLAICHHQPLGSLASLGFSDAVDPFLPVRNSRPRRPHPSSTTPVHQAGRGTSARSRSGLRHFPTRPSDASRYSAKGSVPPVSLTSGHRSSGPRVSLLNRLCRLLVDDRHDGMGEEQESVV